MRGSKRSPCTMKTRLLLSQQARTTQASPRARSTPITRGMLRSLRGKCCRRAEQSVGFRRPSWKTSCESSKCGRDAAGMPTGRPCLCLAPTDSRPLFSPCLFVALLYYNWLTSKSASGHCLRPEPCNFSGLILLQKPRRKQQRAAFARSFFLDGLVLVECAATCRDVQPMCRKILRLETCERSRKQNPWPAETCRSRKGEGRKQN